MDAFYASVEARDDPTLAGKPVAVGSAGPRGVVMSASYEARAFGVRSAMPSVRARRLCPDLAFVPPDFRRYKAESDRVMAILGAYTPLVEPLSLDEAFLDVSGAGRLFGSPERIAHAIREQVRSERSLSCSVGVAPNKLLAKLASARAKPDGVLIVRAGAVRDFLDPLPVAELWGVGEQTAAALDRLGARRVGDILALPRGVLARALGPGPAAALEGIARGDDDRQVVPHEPAKQVSAEETYDRDLDAAADVRRELLRLAERVATRLREARLTARTVTIKVPLGNGSRPLRSDEPRPTPRPLARRRRVEPRDGGPHPAAPARRASRPLAARRSGDGYATAAFRGRHGRSRGPRRQATGHAAVAARPRRPAQARRAREDSVNRRRTR
jgi:DNA polymerase-4